MIEYKDILAIFLSYAIGCFSTGYYLTRTFTGKDIRKSGSGSTGARNAGRMLGRIGFAVTFSGDAAKGLIAIWLASILTPHHWAITGSLIAVVAGHIWPAQLGFRGGKGIAVTLGSVLVFDYRIAIACCLVFCLCFVCLRKYMLSGLIAVMAMPVVAALMGNSAVDTVGAMVIAFMILSAHRGNITELIPKKHVDGS
ncbi:MAG: glycerol-3-phosphate acyltransferase [Sedimentisphaerales bacterium]|jgi:glycerol-3-phosphate acyltransferase PlsY